MKQKNMWKAILAISVALAFIMPGAAAFANVGTIGVTSSNKNTVAINTIMDTSNDGDNPEYTEETIVAEKTGDPPMPLAGTIRYVGGSGPGNYTTISLAVAAAFAGDTIYVYNGIYYDHVIVSKRLNLTGESRENVIVNGSGTGYVFSISTPITQVNISTFTITNGQYGIYILTSSNNSITNCNVYATSSHGIYIYKSSDNSITNCDVYKNTGSGIYIYTTSNNNNIMNCNVYNNIQHGIYIYTTSNNNNIMNCNVYNNIQHGIYIYTTSNNNKITNCNSYNNAKDGIYIYTTSNRNKITNCNAYNNSLYGIGLTSSSNNNNITNCNAYNNSQQGIYINSLNNNVTNCTAYNNKNYGIYLNGASNNKLRNNTIYDNVYNFVVGGTTLDHYTQDIDPSNTVNGKPIYYLFQLSNLTLDETKNFGYLGLVSCTNITAKNADVNGVLVIATTYSTISNISSHNSANGIYLGIGSNDNNITNCNAYNNSQQGIALVSSSNNDITNCDAYNNSQYGIYIYTTSNNNVITNCDAYNNSQYGIYIYTTSNNNVITNCDAYNNKNYGIYLNGASNNKLRGNTIYDNVYNFGVTGTTLDHYTQDIDPSNTVNGKPIYYLVNAKNITLDETHNVGYLGLVSCTNITVTNSDVYGIVLANTIKSTISNVSSHNSVTGIYLFSSSNNNITNCDVYKNTGYGIYLGSSNNNNITNCDAYNNTNSGIYLYSSSNNNNIINCDAYNNKNYGIYLGSSNNNNITNCNAYNNSQYGIALMSSSNNNNITNCDAYNKNYGIYLASSSNNDITNCDAYNNSQQGIALVSSSNNNNITNCNAYNNQYGIYLVSSSNNDITNCDAYNNTNSGIYSYYSSNNNNITNCTVYNNKVNGIYLYTISNYNSITNCNAYNNMLYGIYLNSASNYNNITNCNAYNNMYGISFVTNSNGNLIHHDNFVNNVQNAYDACTNLWDDGNVGNYWSDYTGVDANGDGIGDTPYNISGKTPPNKDRYPLMNPWNDTTPPVITDVAATPEVQNTTTPVNITCMVTDNWNLVKTVKIDITGPGGFTLEATMDANESSYWYEDIYAIRGIYFYYIRANDTNGNIAVSDTYTFVIRTELEAPISAVNTLPLWKKTVPFTVTATAYDNTGVANVTLYYRYSNNGTSWTAWTSYGTDEMVPWSWSFTGADGYYQLYSIAVDTQGNVEDSPGVADASTGIDTTKPVTTIGLTGTMGGDNWYTSVVTVTLSATDTLSGIESTWYQKDTGYWTIYTVPFTVSGDGVHTVQYYSFDHAGNQEAAKSVSFKIDTTAPTTTHTLQGLLGSQGWYVTNVTVTLSASDVTSGVNFTKYKLNTGSWIVYVGSFVVTEDGNYTLYYYSVDFAGNTEATKQVAFKIQHDVLPPVTTHEFDGILGENNWFISTVTVTLSAVDDSAGVASTKYKLDAGAWTTYTGTFLVTEDAAVHTLYYYSVDKVGNREADKSATFKIDRTPPEISLAVNKTGLSKWLLTATVSDETSGVAKVEFYLDSEYLGEDATAPYTWECTKQGTAQAIAYDNAGNNAISDPVPVSVNQPVPDSQSQSSPSSQSQSQSISSILQRLFNLR